MEAGFGPGIRPAHAREFEAIFDQMAASALNDAGSDGPAEVEVGLVIHQGQVPLEVVSGLEQSLALAEGHRLGLSQAAQIDDDLIGMAGQQW